MDAKISIHLSINKLQDLLDHDESTTNNPRLKKQVEKAIDSLGAAKQLLKDVDALAEAPFDVSVTDRRNTVRLLRAVYSVEDAADSFVAAKEFHPIKKELNAHDYSLMDMIDDCRQCKVGLQMFIIKMKYFHRRFLFSHKLKRLSSPTLFAKKMKKFNDEVKRLVEMKGDIESNNNNQTRLLTRRQQHWGSVSDFCFEEETHVVGLQQQINKLVDRLIPRQNHNVGQSSGGTEIEALDDHQSSVDVSTTQVIAVVGEAGSGKTTLARIVYNNIHVKRHFAARAWVRISSMFNARDVLLDILTQIGQAADLVGVATLSYEALKRRLSKVVSKEERFLIILDGVDSLQDWESLRGTFSSSSQGGKIVITTRNRDDSPSSSIACQSAINTCRLNDEESWKLFSNKVRITEDELNKLDLITLKEQILKVCAGLPLLVVLLGGLLSTKARNFDKWTRVVSMLADKTSEDAILALSYQDLPSEAKPCFLYMGIFPRNYEIPVRRLIHLWRSEGFVTLPPVPEEVDSEDLAEMCLEELVTRNMVEVRWRLDGVAKTCCMPSVLYDFFFPKAANVEFFHQQSHTVPEQQKLAVRRLTAYTGINHLPTSFHHLRLLRSYVAFDNRVPITPDTGINLLFNKIIADIGFVFLRVLDLEGVFKPKLHLILDKLLLLRHLGLRSSLLDSFPVSKTCLPFLDTLDVKHTNVKDIILHKVNKLQHIYLNYNYERFSERSGENVFPLVSTNLRTLWGLNMNSDDVKKGHYRILLDMTKLTKLKLIVSGFGSALSTVAEWINKLTQLQSLKLNVIKSNDGIFYPMRIAGHQKLQELHLRGSLPQLVFIDGFLPPNIRKLTLSLSELREDPMPVLGQLSHLNILRLLASSYRGKTMNCLSKGFPKLCQLKLWKIIRVEEWTIEEGAMPCLRELEIRSCHHLKVQGLQNVTALKDLVLTNMPEDFGAAILRESLHERDVYIRNNAWNSTLFPVSPDLIILTFSRSNS